MIGDRRETFVITTVAAAYTLANELKTDYEVHRASTVYHKAADTTNTISASDASTATTLYLLVNELKLDFNAHELSTTYHVVGGVNRITSHDATTLALAYVLLDELKTIYNRHIPSIVYHLAGDTSNAITSPSSKYTSINKDFNADGGSVLVELTGSSFNGKVDFQTTPDGTTFYNIPYIDRSTINPAPMKAQIHSPSTATMYLLLGPLSQVRIAVTAGSTGSLTVVFRTIQKVDLSIVPVQTFGQPTLRQSNAGQASWSRYQYAKGGNGWNAKLEGGKQAGASSWASMFVPYKDLPVTELATVLWSYLKTDALDYGVALQIWVHDPTDQKKRAEIGQTMSAPGTTAAWHSEELTITDDEYKWYGENVTDSGGSVPDTCASSGTNYTWAEYMSDSVFSTWTIYRIEFVVGWIGSGTLLPCHLAEVTINGTVIPLGPKNGKSSVVISHSRTIVGGAASANDVVSNGTPSSGTAWQWDVGGSGKVIQASIVIATNGLTPELVLWLYTVTPTCELDDNEANDGPVAGDLTNLVGWIDFPAMTDTSGSSYTIASASTPGNLPLRFKGPILYGVLVNTDASTLGGVTCDIRLAIDIEED